MNVRFCSLANSRDTGNRNAGEVCRGFSLIELMVAMAVLSLLLTLLLSVVNHASSTITFTSEKLNSLQTARSAFDIMNHKLSEVTLNTYWDYDDATRPTKYIRKSDLDFRVEKFGTGHAIFFVAPESFSHLGDVSKTQGLLSACGYFVEYGSDKAFRPSHVKTDRFRYRLMQIVQPAEDLKVFTDPSADWTQALTASDPSSQLAWPIATNVIALIIRPRLSATEDEQGNDIAPNYLYAAQTGTAVQKSQLPPVLETVIITIDEQAANRLCTSAEPPSVIQNALNGRFQDASKFEDDLAAVSDALAAERIAARVFTATVPVQESKWSL